MASLMASQTLILRNPNFLSPHKPTTLSLPSPQKHLLRLTPSKPTTPLYSLRSPTLKRSRVFASSSSSTIPNNPSIDSSNNPNHSLLTESTRTISTIFAIGLSILRLTTSKICNFTLKLKGICTTPSPDELATIQTIQESLVCTVGPLFFAALKDRPSGYLNTPLTVVASGMSKWLDIYSGVLMVRVLLSWFPNIPWDRQPLSAIRDLCDPYLNLFRNIIPPIFDTLDVSPLLAFAVLGTLGSILNNSRGGY
ncbi:ylmG homolog protein 1-2, chloroplastic-like [Cornus florida]|uniref:ylmG homolog protein 1-2, chloroplastic-like n=1 Tax=Cornus florida TaxID=4283 RepID=UPI002896CB9C|nr:ylmG homolog protein 1-2, chloroplastic-like [Cornus florida]XP_059660044.1 ylmG homolog protein 1-2, chloroplastic-like [Cornus florida]